MNDAYSDLLFNFHSTVNSILSFYGSFQDRVRRTVTLSLLAEYLTAAPDADQGIIELSMWTTWRMNWKGRKGMAHLRTVEALVCPFN